MSSYAPWSDIRSRIEAAGLLPPECLSWPNEPFALPGGQLWAAVEATGDLLTPIELGGGAWREDGRLYVHIFTPAGLGSQDARLLAKAFCDLFRFARPTDPMPPGTSGDRVPVRYYGASIGVGEAADIEGGWWRLTVAVDWSMDDHQEQPP